MTVLDLLQLVLSLCVVGAAYCRLNHLHHSTSRKTVWLAQLGMVFGGIVEGLGFMLPGPLADHASAGSIVFVSMVFYCQMVGASRWRGRAPDETNAVLRTAS